MNWLSRLWDDERIRYLVVGVWNTVFSYAVYLLLLRAFAPMHSLESSPVALLALIGHNYYLVVSWLGWCIAVPQSTVVMKYVAFRKGGRLGPQILRAFMIYLPAQGIGSLILWVTVQLFHFSPPIGQLLTICITTIFSYIGHKYFTFRAPLEVGEVAPQELLEDGQ